MFSYIITLLFFILSPVLIFAQSNYQKGYIVNFQADTTKGYIDYKEWSKNPNEISFKLFDSQSTIQKFNSSTIKCFNIEGYDAYESFLVSISMDEIDLSGLNDNAGVSTIIDTVFLKILLKGDKINLYSFKDDIKTRFYVLDKQTENPLELEYKLQRRGSQVITSNTYKQQLINTALKYNVLSRVLDRLIQGTNYRKSDLLTIASKINQVNENKVDHNLQKKQKSRFFISTGLNYNNMVYRGNSDITYDRVQYGHNVYKDRVITHSLLPKFSAGIDWFANPAIQRLIFRGEISAFPVKSETFTVVQYDYPDEEVEYRYKLSAIVISITPQFLYNFYNQENSKIYLGAGLSATLWRFNQHTMYRKPFNTKSDYYETSWDPFKMKDYFMNVLLRAGCILHKKIDISVLYLNPAELTNYSKGSDLSIKSSSLQFSIGYMFNKVK